MRIRGGIGEVKNTTRAGTVTGQVTEAQTGLPVAAVQVFIFTLELGGFSQQNGRYLLQNVDAAILRSSGRI